MLDDVINFDIIKETPTYKSLEKNVMQQNFLRLRNTRKVITNALLIYKTTGQIKSDIGRYNFMVLKDLIALEEQKN